jgi:hypothetical protein
MRPGLDHPTKPMVPESFHFCGGLRHMETPWAGAAHLFISIAPRGACD